MVGKYKVLKYKDYSFFFKFEDDPPDMLHIWSRHTTEPKDAIKTFVEGDTVWNAKHERFETTNTKHTIYWFWLDESEKKIMIITCFSL